MIRALAASAACALLLAGCDVLPEATKHPAKKPHAKATPTPAPHLDPQGRLAAARAAVPAASGNQAFDGDDRLIDTSFGPVLLRHGHVPDAGHAEAGTVAAYYLRELGGAFALVKAYPEAAASGSFGDFSRWSVSNDFSSLPVIVIEGGGTWQGCTVEQTDLIELRPNGPAVVASIPTVFENGGAVEDGAERFDGTIADVARDRSFSVQYKGTASFAERYVRRGDRFQLDGGESRVPGC
ncbi:hypothetical protein AB2M62_16095 [Sphingomonas sp. MMS12-HWE2-04]|uniref:hypothetical protein n=1 Tax=Sphingomonas sp. MMS12-HWE2-04 TaxID=3234199 RepID=UPI00384C7A00